MEIRQNKIRASMESGRKARGLHMRFPAPAIIELCSGEPLDFVYLDCENGSFELREVEASCRAAEAAGITVIARVPRCDPWLIGQFLNLGVQGIIVPHVSTAEEARSAVRACFYPSLGERSYVSARANGHSKTKDDFGAFFARANANVTLSVQLEDVEALRNVDAIAAVRGITYFTIGKQDLAMSMGILRQTDGFDNDVIAVAASMEAAIRKRGGKMKDDVMTLGYVGEFITHGIRSIGRKPE